MNSEANASGELESLKPQATGDGDIDSVLLRADPGCDEVKNNAGFVAELVVEGLDDFVDVVLVPPIELAGVVGDGESRANAAIRGDSDKACKGGPQERATSPS